MPEAWLGPLPSLTLPILPVRVTNPVCPLFSLHAAVLRALSHCLVSPHCGQNPFMNPARITTAFRGVGGRFPICPRCLGMMLLLSAKLTDLPLLDVFPNLCVHVNISNWVSPLYPSNEMPPCEMAPPG